MAELGDWGGWKVEVGGGREGGGGTGSKDDGGRYWVGGGGFCDDLLPALKAGERGREMLVTHTV